MIAGHRLGDEEDRDPGEQGEDRHRGDDREVGEDPVAGAPPAAGRRRQELAGVGRGVDVCFQVARSGIGAAASRAPCYAFP